MPNDLDDVKSWSDDEVVFMENDHGTSAIIRGRIKFRSSTSALERNKTCSDINNDFDVNANGCEGTHGVENIGYIGNDENCEDVGGSKVHGDVDIIDKITGEGGLSEPERSSLEQDGDDTDSTRRFGLRSCIQSVSHHRGILHALLSTILLSLGAISVALLAGSVSSNEVAFTRMFVQLLFCFPTISYQKVSFRLPSTKAYLLVLYRAVVGSISMSFTYYAYQVMPVGNAKAILYSSPIFTGLLGWMLLKEPCTFFDAILSVVTISGVLLVAQPPFIFGEDDSEDASGILGPTLCFIAAFLMGTTYVALRKLGGYGVHPLVMLVVFSFIGMCFSGVVTTVLNEWVNPSCGLDRIVLITNGAINFLSQISLTIALRLEKATYVSLIRTSDVLFSFILEYILFGQIPDFITIIGAFLIVSSLIGITMRKWWTDRKRQQNVQEDMEHEMDEVENSNNVESSKPKEVIPSDATDIMNE